ncbi:hypothetical protein [Agrobacterium rosae]|uniref:hypothetical protein n=1 Tax=Agrobacterium rosae TaxID=1972867 RepID=UPI003BA20254
MFTAIDFSITVSYLEGNGIVVVAMPHNVLNNFQYLSNAMGGVGVMVPARQAQAAINLLIEADRGEKEIEIEAPTPPRRKRKGWIGRVSELLFYIFFGSGTAAPPYSNSRIVHGEWQALGGDSL